MGQWEIVVFRGINGSMKFSYISGNWWGQWEIIVFRGINGPMGDILGN